MSFQSFKFQFFHFSPQTFKFCQLSILLGSVNSFRLLTKMTPFWGFFFFIIKKNEKLLLKQKKKKKKKKKNKKEKKREPRKNKQLKGITLPLKTEQKITIWIAV